MRILVPKKKNKKAKLITGSLALISLAVLVTGGILFNPICIGAGVAGLFLTCGALVSVFKPGNQHPYV
jgi:hypothetical protein